jgi:prepilin-type N-terminal cleavage/methylation domain-containing protein
LFSGDRDFIFKNKIGETMLSRQRRRTNMPRNKGFTLIELLIVLAILGIMMLASYPSVLNNLETRTLENCARNIQTSMQQAKFLAVNTKLNHRVIFSNATSGWAYWIEEESSPGTWISLAKYPHNEIPSKLTPTIDLPADQTVEYSSVGFIINYDSLHNTITIQSDKLKTYTQPDLRILTFLAGGSIQYTKSQST